MNAEILNSLKDVAGVPFYPVVFQALYILTWALHIAFVLFALGSGGLALVGMGKRGHDTNWEIFTPHLIQISKISISILIVLGVAPLLFTQVIYDPNWYVTNTLSGRWVAGFIYLMIVAYSTWYWFYYSSKAKRGYSLLVGVFSFLCLVFAGVIMHAFANEAISVNQWMNWYIPNQNELPDMSGTNFHIDIVRLAFMVSLAIPATGILLLNYRDYLSKAPNYKDEYLNFVKNIGKKMAIVGLLISAVLFLAWMYQVQRVFSPLSIAVVIGVLALLGMVFANAQSYFTTIVLVVVALLISGVRESIRYDIMANLGYSIYDTAVNIDWPSTIMFLLTFVGVGFTGVAFLLTLAWRAGRTEGVYDASKDKTVTLLANSTLVVTIVWAGIFLLWGMFYVFKNTL